MVYESLNYLDVHVGKNHTAELVVHLRDEDLSWFNSDVEGHEEQLFEILSERIVPFEFANIFFKNKESKSSSSSSSSVQRKGNKKNSSRSTTATTKTTKRKVTSKKKKNDEEEDFLTEDNNSKLPLYLFGDTLQVMYKAEELDVDTRALLVVVNDDDDDDDDDARSNIGQSDKNHDVDGSSKRRKLCHFKSLKKLKKRIVVWCFPFDKEKPTASIPKNAGFPRPDMVPIADMFRVV